ncbi:YuiB family protein [Bacillus rubiinfantis]|uniref:YuiB family protein n=1 Tax=Bacillus rubiinfantis TaxID=1499680 RepID=UPI000B193597|nr:YuiB family protein [Bacillus rubiinfantis]
MNIAFLLISVVLFFVLFFGIGFILNMILRMTWVMTIIYPLIVIFIVDKVSFIDYFVDSKVAFTDLGERLSSLASADIIILLSGLVGAICSGFTIRVLRKRGYQMF